MALIKSARYASIITFSSPSTCEGHGPQLPPKMALPARPYDPLYDTTYTVSGARDHYRQQTVAGGFQIEKAPEYPNMFSELPHFPATTYRLKNSDKVPAFVNRTFQPEVKDSGTMTLKSQPTMVAGQQRFKYFRRPMLASAQPVLIKQAPVVEVAPPPPTVPEPKTKTMGTQSDYRESEAQTMPWDPDIVLPDTASTKQQYLSQRFNCEGPELLQLKDMKFGDGLPPGLQEVRRIEKLRAKRAFEATLPPINDLEHLPLRQKMIEEWEAKEWDDREGEILGVQDERLDLIDQALQVREEEVEAGSLRRVEDRKVAMLQQKAPQFAAIQANRIKTMRQLIESRKYVERHRKLIKPTIVERYANFGSTTYAPVQREGRFPETKPQHKTIETEGYQPVTLEGIADLEMFLPVKLLQPKVINPRAVGKPDYKQRQEALIQKDLKAINELLDSARSLKGLGFGDCWPAPLKESEASLVSTAGGGGAAAVASLRASQAASAHKAVVRAVERPDTPELSPPTSLSASGDREAAAVLLQRLLRGRAAQNIMYEGKVRRMQLIKELQLEATAAATYARPEDRHPAAVRLDALLGSMVSQLAVALTTQDDDKRAALIAEALASTQAASQDLDAYALAAAAPRSRQTTPLRAADVYGAAEAMEAFPAAPQQAEEEVAVAEAEEGGEAEGTERGASPSQQRPVSQAASTWGKLELTKEEAEAAAVKIQSAFKGHKARKDVAAMRKRGAALKAEMERGTMKTRHSHALPFNAEEYTSEHVAAVTKIQAVQRGRIARKRFKAKRQSMTQGGTEPAHAHDHGAEQQQQQEAAVAAVFELPPAQEAEEGDAAAQAEVVAEADAPAAAQPAEGEAEPAAAEAASAEEETEQSQGTGSEDVSTAAPPEAAAQEEGEAPSPAAADADEAAAPAPSQPEDVAASTEALQEDAPALGEAQPAEEAQPAQEAAEPAEPAAAEGKATDAEASAAAESAEATSAAAAAAAEPSEGESPAPAAEETGLGHEATLGNVGLGKADHEDEEEEGGAPALHAEATLGAVGHEGEEGAAAAAGEEEAEAAAGQESHAEEEAQIDLAPPGAAAELAAPAPAADDEPVAAEAEQEEAAAKQPAEPAEEPAGEPTVEEAAAEEPAAEEAAAEPAAEQAAEEAPAEAADEAAAAEEEEEAPATAEDAPAEAATEDAPVEEAAAKEAPAEEAAAEDAPAEEAATEDAPAEEAAAEDAPAEDSPTETAAEEAAGEATEEADAEASEAAPADQEEQAPAATSEAEGGAADAGEPAAAGPQAEDQAEEE